MTPSLAFTLIELLIVLALIGILASTVAVVAVYVRKVSVRVECQGHMREIGKTLNAMMLANGGEFPTLDLTDDNTKIPWWAQVFSEWTGNESAKIDTDAAAGLQLPIQLPAQMAVFHCRMGGALQNSPNEGNMAVRATNLSNSISYGLHFDVKLDDGTPYECVAGTNQLTAATATPDDDDKKADTFNFSEVKDAARFIVMSEADTQDPDPANWTGGRISMGAVNAPPNDAPIAGRHEGWANVLFADMHVEMMQANGEHWAKNINDNTALWTLPND